MTDQPEPVSESEVLENRIFKAIEVARSTGRVSYCETIGVLEMVKMEIYKEAIKQNDIDNDIEGEYP